jgi:hypothetical protein
LVGRRARALSRGVAPSTEVPPCGMRWTPQAHYRMSAEDPVATQRKGYWENAPPEPDPEPEPAGPDAKTWNTSSVVPTVTVAAAEAVADALKAHAELASRLEAAELLEGASGADSIVWKLPGLEQTAPAALPSGVCISRSQSSTRLCLSMPHASLHPHSRSQACASSAVPVLSSTSSGRNGSCARKLTLATETTAAWLCSCTWLGMPSLSRWRSHCALWPRTVTR